MRIQYTPDLTPGPKAPRWIVTSKSMSQIPFTQHHPLGRGCTEWEPISLWSSWHTRTSRGLTISLCPGCAEPWKARLDGHLCSLREREMCSYSVICNLGPMQSKSGRLRFTEAAATSTDTITWLWQWLLLLYPPHQSAPGSAVLITLP